MLECQLEDSREKFYNCKKLMIMTENKKFPVHEIMCKKCQEDSASLEELLKNYLFNMGMSGKMNKRLIELSEGLLTYDYYKLKLLQLLVFGGQTKEKIKEIINNFKRKDLDKDFKKFIRNISTETCNFFENEMQKQYNINKDSCKQFLLVTAKLGYVPEENIRKFVKKVGLDKE
jgi:hypothetical protein